MIRIKLWYVSLLLFFGLLAVLYDEHSTMVILLTMGMLPILLWMIGFYFKKCVDIQVNSDTLVGTKQDPYAVALLLRNRGFLPIPKIKVVVEYRNRFMDHTRRELLLTALEARSELELSLSAQSSYSGISEYQIKRLEVYDYLSMWKFRKKSSAFAMVTILPELTIIERSLVQDNPNVLVESEVFSGSKSGDDPSELYGIREYEHGDKMNRIHWKLSLKQDELMVKEFGLPINCAVAIMVDFKGLTGSKDIATVDGMLDAVLSLSVSMILQKQIHYVIWYDDRVDDCQRVRVEQEEDIYEAISRIFHCNLYGMEHSLINYHDAHYGKEQYTNLYYITSYMGEDMLNALNQARKSALTRVFFLVKEGLVMDEALGLTISSMGMSYHLLQQGDMVNSLMQV